MQSFACRREDGVLRECCAHASASTRYDAAAASRYVAPRARAAAAAFCMPSRQPPLYGGCHGHAQAAQAAPLRDSSGAVQLAQTLSYTRAASSLCAMRGQRRCPTRRRDTPLLPPLRLPAVHHAAAPVNAAADLPVFHAHAPAHTCFTLPRQQQVFADKVPAFASSTGDRYREAVLHTRIEAASTAENTCSCPSIHTRPSRAPRLLLPPCLPIRVNRGEQQEDSTDRAISPERALHTAAAST